MKRWMVITLLVVLLLGTIASFYVISKSWKKDNDEIEWEPEVTYETVRIDIYDKDSNQFPRGKADKVIEDKKEIEELEEQLEKIVYPEWSENAETVNMFIEELERETFEKVYYFNYMIDGYGKDAETEIFRTMIVFLGDKDGNSYVGERNLDAFSKYENEKSQEIKEIINKWYKKGA